MQVYDPLSAGPGTAEPTPVLPTGTLSPALSQAVSNFIHQLRTKRYAKPLTSNQLSDVFHEFYEQFVEQCKDGDRESVVLAESQLTTRLYDRLINKFEDEDLVMNQFIKKKIKVMQNISTLDYRSLLDIDERVDIQLPIFTQLSSGLAELAHLKSPTDKLGLVITTHNKLSSLLRDLHLESTNDHLLPLVIYLLLIHQEDTDFWLHYQYIQRFHNQFTLIGENVYCLTNLEAALTFIKSVALDEEDAKELSEEFKSMVLNSMGKKEDGMLFNSLKSVITEGIKYNPLEQLYQVVKGGQDVTALNNSKEEILDLKRVSNNASKLASRQFKDLTVTELEQVFEDYKILTKWFREHQ